MKSFCYFICALLISFKAFSQEIFVATYGNPKHEPVLFLHGGPGYNSVLFEKSTAQKIADKGFFVIVYDRRGEGRSMKMNAKFTFTQTFDDINTILDSLKITKTSIIGHSFGGIIAILYASKFSEKMNSIALVGVPVSLQQTFNHIIKSSKTIYESKKDLTNLNYISMLEEMDKTSIQFSSYCFAHAMYNGFYIPKKPTKEAVNIYAELRKDPNTMEFLSKMTTQAPKGFLENENYTTINLTDKIKNLRIKKLKIYCFYGKDDGLFSEEQISDLSSIIGHENMYNYKDCSHNVFIDQQEIFINDFIETTIQK